LSVILTMVCVLPVPGGPWINVNGNGGLHISLHMQASIASNWSWLNRWFTALMWRFKLFSRGSCCLSSVEVAVDGIGRSNELRMRFNTSEFCTRISTTNSPCRVRSMSIVHQALVKDLIVLSQARKRCSSCSPASHQANLSLSQVLKVISLLPTSHWCSQLFWVQLRRCCFLWWCLQRKAWSVFVVCKSYPTWRMWCRRACRPHYRRCSRV